MNRNYAEQGLNSEHTFKYQSLNIGLDAAFSLIIGLDAAFSLIIGLDAAFSLINLP